MHQVSRSCPVLFFVYRYLYYRIETNSILVRYPTQFSLYIRVSTTRCRISVGIKSGTVVVSASIFFAICRWSPAHSDGRHGGALSLPPPILFANNFEKLRLLVLYTRYIPGRCFLLLLEKNLTASYRSIYTRYQVPYINIYMLEGVIKAVYMLSSVLFTASFSFILK